jgi:hypothetical protein
LTVAVLFATSSTRKVKAEYAAMPCPWYNKSPVVISDTQLIVRERHEGGGREK